MTDTLIIELPTWLRLPEGKKAGPCLDRVDCDENAAFQLLLELSKGEHDEISEGGRRFLLTSKLHDAWSMKLFRSQQRPEIEVVCEDHPAVVASQFQNLTVGG
jgi:hypothetical protein